MSRPRRRMKIPKDKPDVAGARAELERVKRQRPDVEKLVGDLVRERQLNNFTANVVATFRGGRA